MSILVSGEKKRNMRAWCIWELEARVACGEVVGDNRQKGEESRRASNLYLEKKLLCHWFGNYGITDMMNQGTSCWGWRVGTGFYSVRCLSVSLASTNGIPVLGAPDVTIKIVSLRCQISSGRQHCHGWEPLLWKWPANLQGSVHVSMCEGTRA